MKTIELAIISPYNKDNLVFLIKDLLKLNSKTNFIATTGSYNVLKDITTNLLSIETYTGYKESPEGLVKTLHPKIFFGILGSYSISEHVTFFNEIISDAFELLVSNLYPFWQIKDQKLSIEQLTYYWDIGGPSMIMAAIKGGHTIVLTDPTDYSNFIQSIGTPSDENVKFFKELNFKALNYVVEYHKMIGEYFERDFNLL